MSHQKALPFFLLLGVATLSAQAQAFESLATSDVEITVDNIVYIDRTISGEMVGMEEEVTVRFLKLANGQLLYERSRQAPAALEFNERSCALVDRPVFEGHRNLIVAGNSAVPIDCGMNDADYERWEKTFGRPHPDRSEKETGEETAAQPSAGLYGSYPCFAEVMAIAPGSAYVNENFLFVLDYSITVPGGSSDVGGFSVSGGIGGAGCHIGSSGSSVAGGYEEAMSLFTWCNASTPGLLDGAASAEAYGSMDSCYDSGSVFVMIY